MPQNIITNFILLPELKLIKTERLRKFQNLYHCSKDKKPEVCPRCATLAQTTYDHRYVVVEDAPIRGFGVRLRIKKRRMWCKTCKRPFTEPMTTSRSSSGNSSL